MGSEYDLKFEEMRKYIPFLESMIKRLESTGSSTDKNPRQAQLDKIRSLRDLLLDRKKRMKMENLLKCEQVLINLYAKVEQRDSFGDIKSAKETDENLKSIEKSNLEAVRNKLKTVTKIQEADTLPEIARASDTEQTCTPGSKMPALFQRRPNKSSVSPNRSPPKSRQQAAHSQQRRNYTRVLVSPDSSPSSWSASKESESPKALFSRRSPKKSPRKQSPTYKKEKKKAYKESKSRKSKDVNITLKVPEERLSSIDTTNIVSRIINCSDSDVDITMLRELRSQILNELKQTGTNDDISDLILKSYNKKSKREKKKKEEVEEGELEESESETIENIYGSLVVVDKDEKFPIEDKNASDKGIQQRKIQICLVIDSKKEVLNANNDFNIKPQEAVDSSEIEMFSARDINESKDMISNNLDSLSLSKKDINDLKSNVDVVKQLDFGSKHEQILSENDNANENQNIGIKSAVSPSCNNKEDEKYLDFHENLNYLNKESTLNKDTTNDVFAIGLITRENCNDPKNLEPTNTSTHPRSIADKEPKVQDNTEVNPALLTKAIANFYKPLPGHEVTEEDQVTKSPVSDTVPSTIDIKETLARKVLLSSSTEDVVGSSKIPLGNESTLPTKVVTDVLSEIDILQALKNEILSETIPISNSEISTPALHQPKLTKVSSTQVLPKKRISIEKYKEKATPTQSLFSNRDDKNKKQSLMLTEKECERFNFSKRLSLDDDVDDLSDDELLKDDKDTVLSLNAIYGDLAPKSPDDDILNDESSSPIIIPENPVKSTLTPVMTDVDMRKLPDLSPARNFSTQLVSPSKGIGVVVKKPPLLETPKYESRNEQNLKSGDRNRIDPRLRKDLNSSNINEIASCHSASFPDRTPLSAPFLDMAPILTPSYLPSMTPMPLMTPNTRTFGMTPTHQSYELDDSSTQKHVYAPTFSTYDNDRESLAVKDSQWEKNKSDSINRRNLWDDTSSRAKWEELNTRNNDQRPNSSRYQLKSNTYHIDRRDSYTNIDCPGTPAPSFGWTECPSTPGSGFGRKETPMTPINSFGRTDCPSTPKHPFGRAECPSTPIHQFGRSDCPQVPNHPFSRSDVQTLGRTDPRINRRKSEFESHSYDDRETSRYRGRNYSQGSFKPHKRYMDRNDPSRHYDRDGNYCEQDRNRNDRGRRESSLGRSLSNDLESGSLYTRNRDSQYDNRRSKNYNDFRSHQDQRETSVGRVPSTPSRVSNFGRIPTTDSNKTLSVESHAGRSFTINTSVNTSFQGFMDKRNIQDFDYTFDARRKRAASVGRLLPQEISVSHTVSSAPNSKVSTASNPFRKNFKRASSVGRELKSNSNERSFRDIKTDFENFKKNLNLKVFNTQDSKKECDSRSKKDRFACNSQVATQMIKKYSPKKNNRDPRVHREYIDPRNKYSRRCYDSRNRRNSGIVYSNDNIAKGTIMGSGFGVKNYKIPKIKRENTEDDESSNDKSKPKETNISENRIESLKCTSLKSKVRKLNNIKDDLVDSSKKATRSSYVNDKSKSSDNIHNINTRRSKILNISDSESENSDLIKEKEVYNVHKNLTSPTSSRTKKFSEDILDKTIPKKNEASFEKNMPIKPDKNEVNEIVLKKPNDDINDNISEEKIIEKTVVKNPEDDILDTSFAVDDLELFSENIGSDPVIENINDLIAGLDQHLDNNKTETTEMEKIMETLDSQESDSLGDISDVIAKDLNESSEIIKQNADTDDIKDKKSGELVLLNIDTSSPVDQSLDKVTNKRKEINEDSETVKEAISTEEASINQNLPKLNEDIVSTTDLDQEGKHDKCAEFAAINNDEPIPDSTINKSVEISNKTGDQFPDSTYEMHNEHSSEVTSTYDNDNKSKKESISKNSDIKEASSVESIGSLLSILQDKSKMKELLSMLGSQSCSNDKIKKKLEKLSEIVSDDDEDNEIDTNEATNKNSDVKNPGVDIKKVEDTEESCTPNEIKETAQHKDDKPPISQISSAANERNEKDTLNLNTHCIKEDNVNPAKTKDTNVEDVLNADISSRNYKEDVTTVTEGNEEHDEENQPLLEIKKKVTKKTKGKRGKKFKKSAITKTKSSNQTAVKNTAKKYVKNKPSRELQKLHDDIKEMFMSKEVLNATGIRMCRLAKLGSENAENIKEDSTPIGTEPVVVLQKFKKSNNREESIRKKPGPKGKIKATTVKVTNTQKSLDDINKILELEVKASKPKTFNRPGPKSKTKAKNEDPYEFDTDSITDTNTTKESEEGSSESDNDSLSSHSSSSSEVLAEPKKKVKRKRGGWQAGIIKPKTRKKKEEKPTDTSREDSSKDEEVLKSPVTAVPDLNCFTDKNYCFRKDILTYDCRLCMYIGSDIVNHYKTRHPHSEIPLSRLDPETARAVIQQCEEINFNAVGNPLRYKNKFNCRFCYKEFFHSKVALEKFFWHVVSTHTGEYKKMCSECINLKRCPFNLDIPPPPKDYKGHLMGYICGKCNYTQISLENLKTHVIVRHNDEQTEVFSINLAEMSSKAISAILRLQKTAEAQPRVLRSTRSSLSTVDASDDRSDVTGSSENISEPTYSASELNTVQKKVDKTSFTDKMKSKLTFENDLELVDETVVKVERDEQEVVDQEEASHIDEPESADNADKDPTDSIMDYPHFKLNATGSGAKEYVCCINGIDNHYKTSLLISLKKHIQTKHTEKWDGYCCICKAIVTLQGVQSDFRDCLKHFLDKHLDDFPVLKHDETQNNQNQLLLPPTETIPVQKTDSPQYLALRPIAELITKELAKELDGSASTESSAPLPKIENVVSLGEVKGKPSVPSPVYPIAKEPPPEPEQPFLYEEVQAKVMSKKHRVILDAMITKDALVRVFKCAGEFCSFTSDSTEDALVHASTHQRVGGAGALDCAYCNFDASGNAIDLVMHVFKMHGHCQYSCSLCFYRAVASQLVVAHYEKAHGIKGGPPKVYRNAATVVPATDDSTSLLKREDAVPQYICVHGESPNKCHFRTYLPGKFSEHLQLKHSTESRHPCHLCSEMFGTPNMLVQHMKNHGLRLYQCAWCVHGGNVEEHMLSHSASMHPGRRPQSYLRFITKKDGQARVLPLAHLNKNKISAIIDITPADSKDNPVRDAERSIELEKLIGVTNLMIESTNQDTPLGNTPNKETDNIEADCSEALPENIPETINVDIQSTLDSLLLASPQKMQVPTTPAKEDSISVATVVFSTVPVKAEPEVTPFINRQSEIICLDSDEEPNESVTEQASTQNLSIEMVIPTEKLTEQNTYSAEVPIIRNKSNAEDKILGTGSSAEVPIVQRKLNVEELISSNRFEDEIILSEKSSAEEPISRNINTKVSTTETRTEIQLNSAQTSRISVSDEDSNATESVIDLSGDLAPTTSDDPPAEATQNYIKAEEFFKCWLCSNTFKAARWYRSHVTTCCAGMAALRCPHSCPATARDAAELLRHMYTAHRPAPAYRCAFCEHNFNSAAGVKLHMRAIHKVVKFKSITETSEDGGLRVIMQSDESGKSRQRRIPPPAQTPPTPSSTVERYGIGDADKLPITPILDSPVHCDLCDFSTKVRLNMVRHLHLHASSRPAPSSEPVNPVPHLETNEMHFDKMLNLASSSLNERAARAAASGAGGAERGVMQRMPRELAGRYPCYVAPRQRLACGAHGCSYLSLDEDMLRKHWLTLHEGSVEFRCKHCPPHQRRNATPLSAPRVLAHLRMHDAELFACSLCDYYHYKRQLVDKHLSEAHGGAGAVAVVREPQPAGPAPAAPAPPAAAPAPVAASSMDLKPWQCGLCRFSTMLRPAITEHCATAHSSKMQFKCSYCPFRTSALENVAKHQTNAHATREPDVLYYYYREGSEGDVDAEGVPRWVRQCRRLGFSDRVKADPDPVPAAPAAPPAPPAVPPVNLDIVKKEKDDAPKTLLTVAELEAKFGAFCEPNGISFRCPLCSVVTKPARDEMQSHLFEELNYRRWGCGVCSYKAFHKAGLHDHMASEHSRQHIEPTSLPTDFNIEKWVSELLDHQQNFIDKHKENLIIQKVQVPQPSPSTLTSKKPDSPKVSVSQTLSSSEKELVHSFGSFGVPKNQQFSCPKCDFVARDEEQMRNHLESELTKIRWCCTMCSDKFQTYHEAQFHCKGHSESARPREAVRDPTLRSSWLAAVIATQRRAMVSVPEHIPEETCDPAENSLLVVRYAEEVPADGRPRKRVPDPDSDDDTLVIAEHAEKRARLDSKSCPYCNFVGKTNDVTRIHILKHYKMKPYKCRHCDFASTQGAVLNHIDRVHPGTTRLAIRIPVPDSPPDDMIPPKRAEEETRKVCLYCEKSVSENEIPFHVHDTEKAEFALRGTVVVKCGKCLTLRLHQISLQEHFAKCHPGETLDYAYFRLLVEKREINCCGHCYRKFKFLRDLRAHHSAMHSSLSFSYTTIPFNHNLHTEGDDSSKRKLDEPTLPPGKRVAKKSTTKLPNSAVAKKSTTKLPMSSGSTEYSFYGSKPLPFKHYNNITLLMNMPNSNSQVEVDVKNLSEILKINPSVVLKDCYR